MPWKIKIVNDARRENEINGRKEQWASWFYGIRGVCWYLNKDNGLAPENSYNDRISVTSRNMTQNNEIILETDPTNNFKNCFREDKYLDLALVFCNYSGHYLFKHEVKFEVKGGGMFDDYYYYVNKIAVVASYYENQKLETTIRIINNKDIDIETRKVE